MALHKVSVEGDRVTLTCSCGWSERSGSDLGETVLAHLDDVRRRREQAEARLRESVDDPDVRVEL